MYQRILRRHGVRTFALLVAMSALVLFAQTATAQSPAPTLSVDYSPNPAPQNVSYVVTWNSTNATNVSWSCTGGWTGSGSVATLSGSSVGTTNFMPVGGTTNCVWTATGPGGSTSVTAPMTILAPALSVAQSAPTITVSYAPNPAPQNVSYTVSWASTDATNVFWNCSGGWTGSGSVATLSGSSVGTTNFMPNGGTTFCVWTATGPGGSTSVTVPMTILAPLPLPTIVVSYSPNPAPFGASYTVTWNSTNATDVSWSCTGGWTGSGSVATLSGSSVGIADFMPNGGTSTCVWTATGPGGSVRQTDPITIFPPSGAPPASVAPSVATSSPAPLSRLAPVSATIPPCFTSEGGACDFSSLATVAAANGIEFQPVTRHSDGSIDWRRVADGTLYRYISIDIASRFLSPSTVLSYYSPESALLSAPSSGVPAIVAQMPATAVSAPNTTAYAGTVADRLAAVPPPPVPNPLPTDPVALEGVVTDLSNYLSVVETGAYPVTNSSNTTNGGVSYTYGTGPTHGVEEAIFHTVDGDVRVNFQQNGNAITVTGFTPDGKPITFHTDDFQGDTYSVRVVQYDDGSPWIQSDLNMVVKTDLATGNYVVSGTMIDAAGGATAFDLRGGISVVTDLATGNLIFDGKGNVITDIVPSSTYQEKYDPQTGNTTVIGSNTVTGVYTYTYDASGKCVSGCDGVTSGWNTDHFAPVTLGDTLDSPLGSRQFEWLDNDGLLDSFGGEVYFDFGGGFGGGGGGGGCFTKGTRVAMADGSTKPIEAVREGDIVATALGAARVGRSYSLAYSGNLYAFNGSSNHFVTGSHPFMTTEGWKAIDVHRARKEHPGLVIGELLPGDTLVLSGGRTMPVSVIDGIARMTTVYNLEVDGASEFYADGYRVHNTLWEDKF